MATATEEVHVRDVSPGACVVVEGPSASVPRGAPLCGFLHRFWSCRKKSPQNSMATATEEEHVRDVSHPLLISREAPPTFTDDTVWIGFMDIVPVIGTVKEAVELVLAVYEGDKAVIKEKEKALENIVEGSFKKDKSTLSDKPAAAADQYSGLRNVREVKKEFIIEYMAKGSKSGATPLTPVQQKEKEREKRVEDIRKDMLKKIHIIDLDYQEKLKEPLKEQLGRSNKGEHVFNNNILKFHSDVLEKFIDKYHVDKLQGYDQHQHAINELDGHTLPQITEKDIGKNMVVDFDKDEFYVNANAVMYGVYCRVLREAMIAVLRQINPDDVTEEERERVIFVIDNMNKYEIYVDPPAKVKWIDNNVTNQIQFERVRGEVAHMYDTDRGVDWCIRILTEVAPLFGPRQ